MAKETKGSDNTMKIIAGIALVAVILIAAAYFGGFFGKGTDSTQQAPPSQFSYNSTKIFLQSFDRGAALSEYSLAYADNDNGAKTTYRLMVNRTDSWIGVNGEFGSLEGFFRANNSSDTICLTYKDETKCAEVVENDTSREIANGLVILKPTRDAYAAQKLETTKSITAGAITMSSGITEEKVGPFDTQRIEYDLDYRNVTVQALTSLGLSPNDASLYTTTDQHVIFWIDKASGLIVKIRATYKENSQPGYFEREYSVAQPTAPALPARPASLVSATSLVQFYSAAEQDYSDRLACGSLPAAERDACYKTLAVDRNNWEICKQINSTTEYERCMVILAQNTRNDVLCERLSLFADECHISVAGETGDFGLCKNLVNTSLNEDCISSASLGRQKQEALQQQYEQQASARNCNINDDCVMAGNANQFCVPKNVSGTYVNETSPLFSCLEGVPCGCNSGYCGFAKNETYYQCVDAIELEELKGYLEYLSHPANGTNSSQG